MMRANLKFPRVFYGWWVVGACFLVAMYVAGVIFYGFTAIFESIADEFGWSYAQISLAASLRGLEIGLLAPIVGLLVDRFGPRRLIFGGGIISTLGLVLLSQTSSLLMFYGAFILLAVGVSTTAQTVLLTAVANWFQRKVGLATGIVISGFGFGGLLVPVIVKLIDAYDWRTTVILLAAGMLVVVLPLSLLVRHKPEQYGYLPDGDAIQTDSPKIDCPTPSSPDADITPGQALKSRSFWILSLVFLGHTMLAIGIITHVMPYLNSIGIERSAAGLMTTAIALMSITGRISFGWLGDKMDKRQVAAICLAMMSLGVFCFGYTPFIGGWLLLPFLFLFSIGFGGSNVQRAILTRELFGRKHFGTIFGFMIGINTLGSMAGPVLAGGAFDHWGSYQGYQYVWFIFAGIAFAAMIAVLNVPHRSTKEENISV